MNQTSNEQKVTRSSHNHSVLFRLFFSEPHGGTLAWIIFLIVTGAMIGFAWIAGYDFLTQLGILLFGGFSIPWSESLAEILPKKHWRLAGVIRILGWVCFLCIIVGSLIWVATSK